MKTRKRQWFACLIFLIIIGLFPLAASAENYEIYIKNSEPVTSGGIQITSNNAGDVLGDGTVSYDSATHTLSLKGASLTQIENKTGEPFTIHVSGESKVAITSGPADLITSNAALTITGDADAVLTLSGSGIDTMNLVSCIKAQGDVTVEAITLFLKEIYYGIFSTGNITIQNAATINGNTRAIFYIKNDAGKLTIQNSNVAAPWEGEESAIFSVTTVEELYIIRSNVTCTSNNGILSTSVISIENSTVDLTNTGQYSSGLSSNDSMEIINSSVTSTSEAGCALYGHKSLTITGSHVTATSGRKVPAIDTSGTLTINGPVTIETKTSSSKPISFGKDENGNDAIQIMSSSGFSSATYDIYAGADSAGASKISGSPFTSNADVTRSIMSDSTNNTLYSYFRIVEHKHTGGQPTCATSARCDDCDKLYLDPTNHEDLTKFEAVQPTHSTAGHIQYWFCSSCRKYFTDEDATQEISANDIVISAVPEHTFGDWTTIKEATETEQGARERACTICGFKQTETIPVTEHVHAFASDWSSDESGHWHACACGQKADAAGHTFGDWTVTKEATETEPGARERACTVCGFKQSETIPVTEHVHVFASDWSSDESGHWHACACGEKADAAGHTFIWITDKEASETEKGSKHEECSVCGYQKPAVETPLVPVPSLPQTGDSSRLALWISLFVLAAAGIAGAFIRVQKEDRRS